MVDLQKRSHKYLQKNAYMANYSAIKAAVNAYIKANGKKEITGHILNSVLNATIDSLGRYFQFAGGALPTDDPGTPDQNVCYLAGEPGVYTNFGGITIENEEVALLFWNGEWTKQRVLLGIQEVEASVDNQVGTPSVDVSYSGGQLMLTFHNLKGETGDAAGFGTIGADINGGVGTPGVSVESSGDNTAKNLMFHFTNLKGETGVTSVVATIDDTSGTPSCQVSLVNGVLTLAFSGLKGIKGDTGVSADYPITLYNGLDSDATDQALTAAQGVVLDGKISQLRQEVDGVPSSEVSVESTERVTKSRLNTDGTILEVTSAPSIVRTFPAEAGVNYKISGWVAPSAGTCLYVFLDENNTALSHGEEAIGAARKYSDIEAIAPNGAVTVKVAGNSNEGDIYSDALLVKVSEATQGIIGKITEIDSKVAELDDEIGSIDRKAVVFNGTDGTNPGTQGFVPAPSASDKDKVLYGDGAWREQQEQSDYFYNENVSVDTNSQRFKSYLLNPGSKFVLRATVVSGTSNFFNLYWIKSGGNQLIYSGLPFGYMTDILTVPEDATGVQIYMSPSASGNVNKVEIWDATKTGFFVEKIGQFGLDFLNNRKMISKTVTIPANNHAMDLVSLNEGLLANISGDIYAFISCEPKMSDDKEIRFWNTEDSSSGSVGIHGIEMRQDKLFKIWSNKIFSKVTVPENVVDTNTDVTIVVFAIVPSDTYLKYPLYGKKVMCFGDSITEFKSGIDNKRYSDHLQDYSQATVINAGIGGTRLAQRLTPSPTPSDNQYCVAAFDICNMVISWATGDYSLQEAAIESGLLTEEQQPVYEQKLALMKANPISETDIVTIMGGANDYRGGSQVGTEDQDTTDKGTIFGAVNAMVAALLSVKPTLQINFFSPLIMMFSSTVSTATSSDVYIPEAAPSGLSFPEYIKKIEKAVMGNHCPYFDMYWSLGFNVHNWQTFYGDDYSHPYRGFQVIAERMYRYLLQR
jgi:hypothetical protein